MRSRPSARGDRVAAPVRGQKPHWFVAGSLRAHGTRPPWFSQAGPLVVGGRCRGAVGSRCREGRVRPQGAGTGCIRAPQVSTRREPLVLTTVSVPAWGPADRRPSVQGILHFQLGRGEPMLHTRLRPHCREFLEKVARLYELHVFTFGSRLYAHTIAGEGRPQAPPGVARPDRTGRPRSHFL